MEPDAVQPQNKPFECRDILLGALSTMSDWTDVYIGLGSNLGERANTLGQAVECLGRHPGIEVLRTSQVRETVPLGGKDQPNYLNAVVQARTSMNGEGLHAQLEATEKSLGRRREEKWGARVIDLDLLLFGDQIIRQTHLTVPHRQMHMRSFMLEPLKELAADLIHPLLHVSIKELLGRLQGGDFVLDAQRPQLISVAGNIGVGKTTLAQRLLDKLGGTILLEPYEDNPFMPEVYAGRRAFALDSQLHFLVHRAAQLEDGALRPGQLYFSDYLFDKEWVYANRLLDQRQMALYKHIYDRLSKSITAPSLLLYLHDASNRCLERIRRRNRPYERGIETAFLDGLGEDYERLVAGWSSSPVIRLDAAEFDCLNEVHLDRLVEQIQHYVCVGPD